MHSYAANGQTPAGANLPIVNLEGAATMRAHIYDLVIGSDATPADRGWEMVLIRTTDNGTGGTAFTGLPLDPLTIAATSLPVYGTFSTAPTDTATGILLGIGMNSRATFRWVAAPRHELVTAATAGNGIMLNCVGVSGGTENVVASVHWWE